MLLTNHLQRFLTVMGEGEGIFLTQFGSHELQEVLIVVDEEDGAVGCLGDIFLLVF